MDKTYYRDHIVNKDHLHSKVYNEIPLDSDKKKLQAVTVISWKM